MPSRAGGASRGGGSRGRGTPTRTPIAGAQQGVWTANLIGPNGRLFADPAPSPDETAFQVDNTSDAYYTSPYYARHADQIQPVPAAPAGPLDLQTIVGPDFLAPIVAGRKISFHAVGDTGASSAGKISQEASVADAMAADVAGAAADAPAFFFHLGDVVYFFGEAAYYYDQYYEPFRGYDRPIFAVPGNHDGAVTYTNGGPDPNVPTLAAFRTNFCAAAPEPPPGAGGLARTTMTQPGVYFTLDAPFVSIIGLYTNVLEGGGVISNNSGRYPTLNGDGQYPWLVSELRRLAPLRAAGERAVILACHHPPASADLIHGGSTELSSDLDAAFTAAGLWPDAILSGHAHLYQRFSRSAGGRAIPYIVAGSGGHARTLPQGSARAGQTWGEFTLETGPTLESGYLTLTVDMRDANAKTLTVAFRAPANAGAADTVTVALG